MGLLCGSNALSIHLWFLYVLFFYELIYFFEIRKLKNLCFLIVIAIIGFLFSYFVTIPIPVGWIWGARSFIFFIMGVLIGQKQIKITAVFIAAIVWLSAFFAYISIQRWNYDDNHPLIIIIPFMAIVVIPAIGRCIKNKFAYILEYFGRRSLTLYMLQQPFLGSALGTILFRFLGLPAWISVIMCVVSSILIPLTVRKIFVKYRWSRMLFGIES